ncbi:MAG TPA: YopX family protein [Clostridia bacterium]|nr:YopX family protein [Clostridia bacterium]
MREIKHRAWHKPSKTMFEVYGISPVAVEEKKSGIKYTYYRNEVILMQYAGLRDKNGTEICEGDILELINEDGEKIRAICRFGNRRLTTKTGTTIDIQCFYFEVGGRKTNPVVNNYLGKHDLEIMEVVSNVFEYLGLSEK